MFHFPPLAPTSLCIQLAVLGYCPSGFPHSDIPGSKPVCGSPRLIAAYHVLRRLLVPRHPPCALSNLAEIIQGARLCRQNCHERYAIVKEPLRESIFPPSSRARARLPLRTLAELLVEIAGIEPATSGLQSRRSPN